ncbi:MAG: hypothetical protein Q9190_000312 [Brigantiaea leucoxantha]
MPNASDFQAVPPVVDYLGFLEPSGLSPPQAQDFIDGDRGLYLDSSDRSVVHSVGLDLPDFEDFGTVDSRLQQVDAPENEYDVSIRFTTLFVLTAIDV